jgi:uncharacterized membrane protein (DUF373 family)
MRKQNTDLLGTNHLEVASKIIAYIVCVGLLLASALVVFDAFKVLFLQDINTAVQDGLFVLILLEMFYVTRSFIQYGSINVGLVINVGIIAAVKELVFQINSITLQLALSFGVIFLTLSVAYLVEAIHFSKKKK